MAYRMSALSEDCFFEDLFALFQVGCTLGEDTILSTRVAKHGELLLAFCATFRHPREEPSLCQAGEPSRRGYAVAYSRRFINDHYRGFDLPTAGDRLALVKSYAGNILLNWLRAMTSFRLHRFAYASGYTLGALRGLLQKPTAASLTPNIDWWAEAERALAGRILIREGIVS